MYAEFKATPNEDVKRVDLALFADNLSEDAIFIECKATGNLAKGLPEDLAKVERQLRDYNKDNTAQLAIITNGRIWRFYYFYTSGKFASKHFKTLNLSEDDLETVAEFFTLFLSKAAVADRSARVAAESYLNLTRKQQKMQDARPEAERRITQYPFPSLPDALMQVVAEQHTAVSRQEAEAFLEGHDGRLLRPAGVAGKAAPGNPAPPEAAPAKTTPDSKAPKRRVAPLPEAAVAFVPAVPEPAPKQPTGEKFTLKQGTAHATAYLQPDGRLLVAAGSLAAAQAAGSIPPKQKVLRPTGDYLEFTENHVFASANTAAVIIVARAVNAQLAWKHATGRQLRDFLAHSNS
ncbi:DUF4357 domain-containing protein [Hymenobacter swuensis]|uniref:DUF4357 domain-containing protein n=1 Tax=Hymenobacter swuensis DY53 TaxID=1227739 RepID=W8F4Z8_9BACT|nr:DUF4357 domain-containing protein [Hymenobacter swuensis]AHJ97691.1 hypothetical protein Hsw_2096 [Hymenobacter swuensis DY53]